MASQRLDIRADPELVARVDRLASHLSHPGAELSRSAATRAALLAGLEVLEAEPSPSKAKPAQKGAKKPPRKA